MDPFFCRVAGSLAVFGFGASPGTPVCAEPEKARGGTVEPHTNQ